MRTSKLFAVFFFLAGAAWSTIPFAEFPFGAYLLTDASGNGNNLTAQGSITYVNNACLGSSIGPESGANYPTDTLGSLSAAMSNLTRGTIELGITTTAAAIAGQGVLWFVKYDGGNFYLQVLNTGKLELVNIPHGIWVLDSATALTADSCYHKITITWDGTNEKIAIDGVQDATSANGFTMGTVTQFAIGNYLPLPNSFPWLGLISDLSLAAQAQIPTVTSTFTTTPTISPSWTITKTPTPTLTLTPSPTKTVTVTPSVTPSRSASLTPSPTRTFTRTLTATRTPSPTPTLTITLTDTKTVTLTRTKTATRTPTPTTSPTRTITKTPTPTPVIATATPTWVVHPPK